MRICCNYTALRCGFEGVLGEGEYHRVGVGFRMRGRVKGDNGPFLVF
jgi:hypothetical protein